MIRLSRFGLLGLTTLVGLVVMGCQGQKDLASKTTPSSPDSSSPTSSDSTGSTTDKGADGATKGPAEVALPDGTVAPITGKDALPKPDKKGLSPDQVKPVPSPKTQGWTKTKLTPQQIADKMDQSFAHLSGVESRVIVLFTLPTGNGRTILDSEFKSPTVFNVQYPGYIDGHPVVERIRSDGKNIGRLLSQAPGGQNSSGQEAWVDIKPLPKVTPGNGSEIATKWQTDMPRVAFGRFTTRHDVFGPLVSQLRSDPTMEVLSEERTKAFKNMLITDYRIVARRKASQVDAKGDVQFEIVVDSKHFVPVTMRTRYGPKGKRVTEIDWAGQWLGGNFEPKFFILPKRGAAKAS